MITIGSTSVQKSNVSLFRSKGSKVMVRQTLRMIKLSGARTQAERMWFDSSPGVENLLPSVLACNFGAL